jgi:hypothetical protein
MQLALDVGASLAVPGLKPDRFASQRRPEGLLFHGGGYSADSFDRTWLENFEAREFRG